MKRHGMLSALPMILMTASPGLSGQPMSLTELRGTVEGTSNLHGWSSEVSEGKGTARLGEEGGAVTALRLAIPIEGIRSGKRVMDDKTATALRADEQPDILFELAGPARIDPATGRTTARGRLTLGGHERPLDLVATCDLAGDRLTCDVEREIDMTDFDIKPPTALMGTLKTGNRVTVRLRAEFTADDAGSSIND